MNPSPLNLSHFSAFLAPRLPHAHKGEFGHVFIIGGDQGYSGAVRLAAEAALRVGAGRVSIATRVEHAEMLNQTRPEIMSHGIQSADELHTLIETATTIVLGPGLGRRAWGRTLFQAVLHAKQPRVIDADGLNLLAEQPVQQSHWILTPHPGEAGRLLNQSALTIQQDRLSAIKKLQTRFGGVLVLKGAGTLILGETSLPSICLSGNPGMATAGMGDVLSGVIGGLLTQSIPLEISAQLGVLIHAMAGDLAAKQGERGMIASDLFPYLRQLINIHSNANSG